MERRVVHIHDILEDPEYRWADDHRHDEEMHRTILAVPMVREDAIIGVIAIRRVRVQLFTDKQIELMQNFANQAVIAIENARLLTELRQRTADLSESLDQQTATADVLKVIGRATFNLQSALDKLAESAARLCDAEMAGITREHEGPITTLPSLTIPQSCTILSRMFDMSTAEEALPGACFWKVELFMCPT